MRLLHITPTYIPAYRYGGPIHSVHSLCRSLVAIGHEVHVLTTSVDGPVDSDVPHGSPVELDGVRVHYTRSQWLRRLYWSANLAAACRQMVGEFEAVHLHSVFLYPTWIGARCAAASHVPYVLSPRGMLDRRLIQARNSVIKRGWINLFERGNLSRAAAIHLTSQEEQRALVELGLALAPAVVIPNGVDAPSPLQENTLSPDVQAVVGAGYDILAFGRINWKKGLDRLIRALTHVPGAELVIAGNDEKGEALRLRALAQSCGVADRVNFIARHVTGADKEALFANSHVLALPSLSENFGNVVVEAMIRGRPVVVSAQVGAAELVATSGGGIVTAGEPAAIGAALSKILGSDNLRIEMGAAGARYARSDLSWHSIAERYVELYANIVQTSRAMRAPHSPLVAAR